MFKQLKKITGALHIPSVEERETAYLNGSVDRIDLEYRQRQIDRGPFPEGLLIAECGAPERRATAAAPSGSLSYAFYE
jgi:hypothetical protein